MVRSAILSQLTGTLLSSRNPDGGWGYYRGRASRVEPTCWAILTLWQSGRSSDDWQPEASFRLLERWRSGRGLLTEHDGQPPNLAFNGLAALLVVHGGRAGFDRQGRLARVGDSLLRGIRTVSGVQFPSTPNSQQDNTLQGWSWIDGTFSWVEPTSMCLLALKKASPPPSRDGAGRINEAERLLFARTCRGGGWNFGTREMFGASLRPYVPTTALALLALQDRKDHPAVLRGVEFLAEHGTSEASGMALGLASIALRVYQRSAGDVESRLVEIAPTTLSVGNLVSVAMAAFALAGGERGVEPFVL